MNSLDSKTTCRKCKAELGANDKFCRQCGTSSGIKIGWWESPWVVLPLLFAVVGPLALPMLWGSRRFTRAWKIALTVVVLGVTVYIVWQVWFILNQMLAPLLELGK